MKNVEVSYTPSDRRACLFRLTICNPIGKHDDEIKNVTELSAVNKPTFQ
jgi:hypothetical protein